MTKIAGSGSGSISQRHGSADPDPDPHQNVMDPEHCSHEIERLFLALSFKSIPDKTGGWGFEFFRGSSDFTLNESVFLVTIFVIHN